MKLVHISDIHIHPQPILDQDPVDRFRQCLAHVAEYQSDADCVVITGDLTHRGDRESYEMLADILAVSPLKGRLTPRLLIGNHDRRDVFLSVFADSGRDTDGFVQWSEDQPAGRFIYMDSVDQGVDSGRYCSARRQWLERELEAASDAGKAAYLFLHHNPVPIHVANADAIGIVDEADLRAIFKRHAGTIRHIFFGHCHFTLSGVVDGIAYSAPRSTNHTCWPDFSGIVDRMGYGDLAPNYNVCFLTPDHSTIHSIDYLDEAKVKWRLD
ncbi:metallophosphoesterase [Rhizobium alvei]|uniref:Metallophosphoesterase n=1 Tax=Rhizobium alvei TaxID=1132659 RepID=A0ABT8YJ51_9HYPH|nr:metallophosphoesterase [Rhizobium alvei]MDO6963724.1 metallophosphoesterase [Rhizobium alvei]